MKAQMQTRWRRGWWWRPGGGGGAGGRALLWGSCWRRAMSALALLRCAWAVSSRHHPATRRPPFPCCRFSRLSVANSVGGAAVPRVCEGGSAGLRRQAGTLPGYGDEGTCFPTLRGAQLTPTAPTAAGPARHDPRLAWPGVSHKDPCSLEYCTATTYSLFGTLNLGSERSGVGPQVSHNLKRLPGAEGPPEGV